MLKFYVDKLLSLEPLSFQKIAYINEPQARLLSAEQKQSFLLQAQACGKSAAESLRQQYSSCTIEQMVQLCGGNIHEIHEIPDQEYTLFAYFEKPNDITVNMAIIKSSEQRIADYQLESLIGKVCIRDLLLSHELYHFLESRRGKDSFVHRGHACVLRLGKFQLMRKLNCLEEMAAMAFSSELLQLSCSPYVFNVIMLYAFHPQQAEKIMADYTRNEEK